jgi:general L-amino acid transport system substrate-binding protein
MEVPMTTKRWRLLAAVLALSLVGAACGDDDGDDQAGGDAEEESETVEFETAQDSSTLATIRDRGNLICGVNDVLPGFGVVDESGEHVGFDVDICRAIATAIFGDPEAVEFVNLTAEQRFTALQSGEIDVLSRNTTWTATRDGAESVRFGPTTFYDGQGFMVTEESGISDVSGLEGARICVLSGTTTELNLTSYLDSEGISFEPVVFEDNTELQPAYESGQCEAWTSDKSQLAAFKSSIEEAGGGNQVILEPTISKEPLGPGVLDGDSELAQIMDWAVFALIQAEEFGITSDNVEGFTSDNPDVQRFLGQEDGFDPGLDLDPEYAAQIIAAVGNYAEMYERHVEPIGLTDRGLNALWTDGGLLYAPPYR